MYWCRKDFCVGCLLFKYLLKINKIKSEKRNGLLDSNSGNTECDVYIYDPKDQN